MTLAEMATWSKTLIANDAIRNNSHKEEIKQMDLRKAVRGSRIKYNGNKRHMLTFVNAQGIPLTPSVFEYVKNGRFVWSVNISFHFRSRVDLRKVVETEFKSHQALKINDLSQYISDLQKEAAEELGDFWKLDHKEWTAKVIS